MVKMTKLSKRQAELFERVCLKRYRVMHEGYMGSWRPNESILVYELDAGRTIAVHTDRSFRSSTYDALRDRGLVRAQRARVGGDNSSEVKPTSEGIELFKAMKGTA